MNCFGMDNGKDRFRHKTLVNTDNVTTYCRGGVSPPRLLDRRNGRGGHTPPLQYAMLGGVVKHWISYDGFYADIHIIDARTRTDASAFDCVLEP
jgi:hypothetical protein